MQVDFFLQGKGAKRLAHHGANAWWARFALPTLQSSSGQGQSVDCLGLID
jgi:hypothetical protein